MSFGKIAFGGSRRYAYIEDELARERLPSGHPGESVIGVCEGQRPGEGV